MTATMAQGRWSVDILYHNVGGYVKKGSISWRMGAIRGIVLRCHCTLQDKSKWGFSLYTVETIDSFNPLVNYAFTEFHHW